MKSKIISTLALVCLLAGSAIPAFAQSTVFTYQGRLNSGTNPANGFYDLTFSLYNVSSGSGQVGNTYFTPNTAVSNGLFTVALDFGASFPGADRWLEIAVRTHGGGTSYTTLAPRQALTAMPYAIQAANASAVSASAVTGAGIQDATITASKVAGGQVVKTLNGLADNITLSAGTNVTLTTNGNSLQISSAGGVGVNLTNFVAKTGDTMSGNLNLSTSANLNFASQERQMLTLYNTGPYNYGIGVQNSTFYLRSGTTYGGFAWYQGGVHSATQNDPGSNGVTLMTLDSYGDLTLPGAVIANGPVSGNSSGGSFGTGVSGYDSSGYTSASGVYGTSSIGKGVYGSSTGNTTASAGVWGENHASSGGTAIIAKAFGTGSTGIYAYGPGLAGYFDGNITVTSNEFFGATTRQMLNLYGGGYGIGVQNSTLYSRSDGGFAWFAGGVHNDNQNNAGGGAALMTLDSSFLTVRGAGGEQAYLGGDGLGADIQIGSRNPAMTTVACYNTANNAYMHVNCSSITIFGGADLAEPFEITAADHEIAQGAVVVIDEENPGHLKLSDRPYDTRVAGVISGAGGINPGIQMQQKGLLEGGKNISLTGRVYVLVDASTGVIKPGDLLTTSNTPGHAMKVTNHNQAQGAILGKAMSSLTQGKGMVLVLVTLQ